MAKVYDTPSDITVESGTVLVDGPDGVAVAMTPEAAAETSDRLLHGASQAAGQIVEAKRQQEERASLKRKQ